MKKLVLLITSLCMWLTIPHNLFAQVLETNWTSPRGTGAGTAYNISGAQFIGDDSYTVFDNPTDVGFYYLFTDMSVFPQVNLAIPSEKIVKGIEVSLLGFRTESSDFQFRVCLSGNNYLNYTEWKTTTGLMSSSTKTSTEQILGNPDDNWGLWSYSQIDESNFRVKVSASGTAGEAWLDAIRVKVYYADPVSPLVIKTSGKLQVPSEITSITAKAWGGGGGGTRYNPGTYSGAGGGGGGFIKGTLNVDPEELIDIKVGSGGLGGGIYYSGENGIQSEVSCTSGKITAFGGEAGNFLTQGGDGGGGTTSGDVISASIYTGGNGASGSATAGGGGGGGAGDSSDGTSATGETGGLGGTIYGGNGGNGSTVSDIATNGLNYGGGGGGSHNESAAGNGANGAVILTWGSSVCLGYAYAIDLEGGVTNSSNVLGLPDGEVANLTWMEGGFLDLDLTGEEPERAPGSKVTVTWRKNGDTNPDVDIEIQSNVILPGWTSVFENLVIENSELESFEIPISFDTRYIIFYMNNDAILDIDAVTYTCNCIAPTPTVIVENFCGYSVLTASGYAGELTWSTGETTESILVYESGVYTVSQKDGECLSLSGLAEVVIWNEPAQPGTISGDATPCEGVEKEYSIDPVSGGTNYMWYVPENWTIKTGQGTPQITVQTGLTYDIEEDAVTVIVNNDYCTGVKSSFLAVQSMAAPDQPGPISGPENPCEKTEVVYSIAPANGATFYYWILPQGWEFTEGHGTTQITVLTGPNNETQSIISVSAGNDCFYSESTNLNVQSKICCTQGEPDIYEDNNTLQTAALIKVGDPAISANILNSKDADWFYFVTGDAGLYQINHVPGSTLEIMALYNSLARKLKPAERNGTAYSLLANTAYYIKVSARLKTPAPCYSLGVEFVVSASFASEQYDDLKSAEIETITEDFYKVWPNPSNNQFNFYNGLGIPVELKITDFTGRTVEFIKNIGLSKTVLFGEKYVSGLYFIEISGDGVKEIFKAVKQ